MKLTQDQVMGLIRHLLTVVGMYMAMKGIFPSEIANEIVGFGLTVAALVWSFRAKTATYDMVMGAIRHALTIVGMYLVFKGTFAGEFVNEAIGMIMSLLAMIWSYGAKTAPVAK